MPPENSIERLNRDRVVPCSECANARIRSTPVISITRLANTLIPMGTAAFLLITIPVAGCHRSVRAIDILRDSSVPEFDLSTAAITVMMEPGYSRFERFERRVVFAAWTTGLVVRIQDLKKASLVGSWGYVDPKRVDEVVGLLWSLFDEFPEEWRDYSGSHMKSHVVQIRNAGSTRILSTVHILAEENSSVSGSHPGNDAVDTSDEADEEEIRNSRTERTRFHNNWVKLFTAIDSLAIPSLDNFSIYNLEPPKYPAR